jgi:uncharacterized protein (TIGR02444 family)
MTDLWQFSCDFYQQEGVKVASLELQDTYLMQVNILLLMRYLGGRNYQIKPEQISELLKSTQTIVKKIESIRQVRRSLSLKEASALWGGVYQKLKQAELEAEKVHIAALEQWSECLTCEQHNSDLDTTFRNAKYSCEKYNILTYWAVHHGIEVNHLNIEELPASLLLLSS